MAPEIGYGRADVLTSGKDSGSTVRMRAKISPISPQPRLTTFEQFAKKVPEVKSTSLSGEILHAARWNLNAIHLLLLLMIARTVAILGLPELPGTNRGAAVPSGEYPLLPRVVARYVVKDCL
jgi:hypothetical protein